MAMLRFNVLSFGVFHRALSDRFYFLDDPTCTCGEFSSILLFAANEI